MTAALASGRASPARIPSWVWGVALAVAVAHLLPTWHAQASVPAGWRFTGNLAATSPDAMQYRVWYRQMAEGGLLGDNRMTGETNEPHLPLVYFAAIGRLSVLLGVVPELVASYVGALTAGVISVLTYLLLRALSPRGVDLRWLFPVTLLGGGLGAYLLVARDLSGVRIPLWDTLVRAPLRTSMTWDQYRGNYPFQALMDPHSGLQWALVLVWVLAHRAALLSCRVIPVAASATIAALTAVVHVYMGVTIAGIAAGIALALMVRSADRRRVWIVTGSVLATLALTMAALFVVFRRGGLPMSQWRAVPVFPAILLTAYPLAAAALAFRGLRLFGDPGFDRRFVLGWAGGCVAVMLSGPFYAYADRGSVSAQLPLMILAGTLWWEHRPDVPRWLAAAVLIAVGATPVRTFCNLMERARFREDAPAVFLSPARRDAVDALRAESQREDLLLARETELRWLAPAHAGRSFCAHFFLTVKYDARRAETDAFFQRDSAAAAAFLAERGIDLLWVGREDVPERFAAIEALTAVHTGAAGTLFRRNAKDGDRLVPK